MPILDDLSDEELQARVDAQKLDPKTEASVNAVMAEFERLIDEIYKENIKGKKCPPKPKGRRLRRASHGTAARPRRISGPR